MIHSLNMVKKQTENILVPGILKMSLDEYTCLMFKNDPLNMLLYNVRHSVLYIVFALNLFHFITDEILDCCIRAVSLLSFSTAGLFPCHASFNYPYKT